MRIFYPGTGPTGAPELRMDQLEAIYRLVREVTTGSLSALVGAGMGSGKTVITTEVIAKTNPNRCLIVGVRDAYGQWAKTFREQGIVRPLLRIDGTVKGQANLAALVNGMPGLYYSGLEKLRAADWETVSETVDLGPDIRAFIGKANADAIESTPRKKPRQLNTFRHMADLDLLVSDEAHKHSNQKSASIKTMNTLPAVAKIGLSGTFFGNKFENAWALSTWLWGKTVIGTKTAFERDYCVRVPVMTKDGRKQLKTASGYPISRTLGEREPGEFVQSLPCYVFVATPIGPVPAPEIVKVDLAPEQRRQYEEMETQSLTWIPADVTRKRSPLVADLGITQRIRLRTAALGAMTLIPGATEDDGDKVTFSPGCKSTTLDAAYQVLHRPDWVGQKVLILTHSKPFAEEAARRIGQKYNVALKTGGVSSAQWELDKASFMQPVSETDSVQYLVAVVSAVGTATDGLQANCSKVLWLSETEAADQNLQADNRVWRDGVDLSTYAAVKLVQRDTIAEGILHANKKKSDGVSRSVGAKVA